MVSSGVVNSDSSSLKSLFTNYDSFITELSSSWKGVSYDNLVSKATEFSTSYLSSVQSQMSSFASACNLYETYKSTKQMLAAAESNYNTAVNNKDSSAASKYSAEISELRAKLNDLKTQIESTLQTVKSVVLEGASSSELDNFGSYGTYMGSVNQTIQSAIDWALATAADDSH